MGCVSRIQYDCPLRGKIYNCCSLTTPCRWLQQFPPCPLHLKELLLFPWLMPFSFLHMASLSLLLLNLIHAWRFTKASQRLFSNSSIAIVSQFSEFQYTSSLFYSLATSSICNNLTLLSSWVPTASCPLNPMLCWTYGNPALAPR